MKTKLKQMMHNCLPCIFRIRLVSLSRKEIEMRHGKNGKKYFKGSGASSYYCGFFCLFACLFVCLKNLEIPKELSCCHI